MLLILYRQRREHPCCILLNDIVLLMSVPFVGYLRKLYFSFEGCFQWGFFYIIIFSFYWHVSTLIHIHIYGIYCTLYIIEE